MVTRNANRKAKGTAAMPVAPIRFSPVDVLSCARADCITVAVRGNDEQSDESQRFLVFGCCMSALKNAYASGEVASGLSLMSP